jgi:enoyl-CoA hydratase
VSDLVRVDREGNVCIVTLNRPEARNAMNAALAGATIEAIESCQDAGAIVLTGSDPAFCAGLDLRNLGVDQLSSLPRFIDAPARSQVPVVAAVNGPAVTGGLELALSCDFIVASERARFADTHLRVGVYPGPVLVELPRRVGMAWAREMSMTGNFVDSQTALRIGLANHVVPHAELLPLAISLAQAIAEQDPAMVKTMRQDWDATDRLPRSDAHRVHYEHAERGGFAGTSSQQLSSRRAAVIERAHQQF